VVVKPDLKTKDFHKDKIHNEDFEKSMKPFGHFRNGAKFAVAVSGGPDSMALCLLAKTWSDKMGFIPVGLTVNHFLRDDSSFEAEQVSDWLKEIGMEHKILIWNQGSELRRMNKSYQNDAREARFNLLCNWCSKNNINILLTAHHADDQIETFFYRLIRGSGIDGLASIRSESFIKGIRVVRPLLDYSKKRLLATCRFYDQKWITDPSNNDISHARVRLRNMIAQLSNEGLKSERIIRTVKHIQRAKKTIDNEVDKFLLSQSVDSIDDRIVISLDSFLELTDEVALRSLARSLSRVSGSFYPPRFRSIIIVYEKLKGFRPWTNQTLHGCKLVVDGKNLFVIPEK